MTGVGRDNAMESPPPRLADLAQLRASATPNGAAAPETSARRSTRMGSVSSSSRSRCRKSARVGLSSVRQLTTAWTLSASGGPKHAAAAAFRLSTVTCRMLRPGTELLQPEHPQRHGAVVGSAATLR